MSHYIAVDRVTTRQFNQMLEKMIRVAPSVPITTLHKPEIGRRILTCVEYLGVSPAIMVADMLEEYEMKANAKKNLSSDYLERKVLQG